MHILALTHRIQCQHNFNFLPPPLTRSLTHSHMKLRIINATWRFFSLLFISVLNTLMPNNANWREKKTQNSNHCRIFTATTIFFPENFIMSQNSCGLYVVSVCSPLKMYILDDYLQFYFVTRKKTRIFLCFFLRCFWNRPMLGSA